MKIIFLQPRFNQQAAASIAQSIGGAVMPMDDLAYDVVANLNDIAATVQDALSGDSGADRRVRGARNRSANGAFREAVFKKCNGEQRLDVPCATHHLPAASLHAPYALPCSESEAAP